MTRTNALESLVISGWVRGLSDRDIEAAVAEVLGAEAALSKSTVSRICQRICEEFEAWRHRDLSALRSIICSWTAATCKMHPGAPAEPVPAAWASISVDGKPVFVGLAPAAGALRLLQDLRRQLVHPPADKEVIDQAVTAAA